MIVGVQIRYLAQLLALIVLIGGSALSGMAQTNVERICNDAFDRVKAAFHPSHVSRRDIFTTDCDYEFRTADRGSLLFSIEKFKSSEKAALSVSESLTDYQDPDLGFGKTRWIQVLPTDEFWSDANLFLSIRGYDTFILLRKDNFVVQAFSDDLSILEDTKQAIRSLKF